MKIKLFAAFLIALGAVFGSAALAVSQPVAVGTLVQATTTIANAGTTSAAISTKGLSLVGIQFPTTFTGTTVTFTMSDTVDGTYVPVYNASGAVSVTIAQARYYALDPKDFQGILFLKIVSGSSEGGARTLKLSLKGM